MNPNASVSSLPFRTLACEKLDVLNDLMRPRPEDVNTAVHDARRLLKTLRALLRMIRPGIGEACYQRENSCLREAARLLAPLRDAWVRLALTETLQRESCEPAVHRALGFASQFLRQEYEETRLDHPPEQIFLQVRQLLESTRKRLPDWPWPEDSADDWSRGCQTTFEKGRSRFQNLLGHPSTFNVHELRKRCKDLRYQLEFLALLKQNSSRPRIRLLHKLTDVLGEHHDLAILRETLVNLDCEKRTGRELAALEESLEGQQRNLFRAGIELGNRIFASPSDAFRSGLEESGRQELRRM